MPLTRGLLVLLGLCGLVTSVSAAPKKLWEVTGLKAPESVVRDPAANVFYVSNMNGTPTDKDGNGFLSKVSTDGKMIAAEWVKGLNAPKGLGYFRGTVFAADIDELVLVDAAKGVIVKKYPAKGAQFLNDVAVGNDGRVFVSDMATNTIWVLDNDTFEPWLTDPRLDSPNGVTVMGDKLVVGGFGKMGEGDHPGTPGKLVEVSLGDRSIQPIGNGSPVGHVDGLEPFDGGAFLVTDWAAGTLLRVDPKGVSEKLLDLGQGSADLTYIAESRAAIIPLMLKNMLVAYQME